MCKKMKGLHNRIDPCMKPLIKFLNEDGWKTVASCCGHSKYPMTVIIRSKTDGSMHELFSGKIIPRKKKFYKKDKQGYYYIPEVKKC